MSVELLELEGESGKKVFLVKDHIVGITLFKEGTFIIGQGQEGGLSQVHMMNMDAYLIKGTPEEIAEKLMA